MSLISVTWATARWSFSIGAKFIRVVPTYTLAVVLATLASQIALLLAFFLPLKVLILLGSSRVPRYFPQAWQAVERDHLVMSLAAGAAGFYLLYLLAEKTVIFCAERGATRLLEKSRKITLFENQDEIALRAYHRYSRSLAGLVFVGLALVFIGFLYPDLALVVLGYGLTTYVLLSLAFALTKRLRARLAEGVSGLMNMLGAVGFLFAFAFMVSDFLMDRPPSVIVAIICLLLVRQLMIRVTGVVTDLSILFTLRLQINALFFHGQKLVADISEREHDFWSLLEMPRRVEWVRGVLREVAGVSPQRIDCVWRQNSIANVVTFEVTACDDSGQILGSYLVKLFNSNHRAPALHEASLLSGCAQGALPSPRFLGANQVDNYHCHLFEWTGAKELSPSELGVKRQEVAVWLISYEPPRALVERYTRSRPLLGQRLSNNMISRLHLVTSNPQQLEQLTVLEQKFHQLRSRLQSLPVQIVNPDMQPDILKCTEGGDVILTHWGRWSIEPVGAGWPVPGWPVSEKDLIRLGEVLDQAKKSRKALIPVVDADIKLAALMFAFENFYQRQQYISALHLLPSVLACIDPGFPR